jgi:hypothetical protein
MGSFSTVTLMEGDKSEHLGETRYKGSCKACHVRGVCSENLLWLMVVIHKLTMPPKSLWKGRPKEKGWLKLKGWFKLKGSVDARPFVDKAKPRENYYHLNTVTFTDTILSAGTHACLEDLFLLLRRSWIWGRNLVQSARSRSWSWPSARLWLWTGHIVKPDDTGKDANAGRGRRQ